MRSAIIAALVGVVAAIPLTETIYSTDVLTITSCGPEVTNCPGRKSTAAVATTSCTEEEHKSQWTAPAEHWSTSSMVAPPVVSTSSVPAPPVMSSVAPVPSSSWAAVTSAAPVPPTTMAVVTSAAPAPPTSMAVVSSAPAPPPYQQTSVPAVVPVPSSKAISKPAVGTSVVPVGSASTGVVPYKTSSPVWSATATGPAVYTGAASHFNAAGAMVGAGAIAALFL